LPSLHVGLIVITLTVTLMRAMCIHQLYSRFSISEKNEEKNHKNTQSENEYAFAYNVNLTQNQDAKVKLFIETNK